MDRRNLRLEWVAGLGVALAMAALPAAAAAAQNVATETTLNVSTSDSGGRTQAAVTANVTDEYGLPAAGAVNIEDGSRILAEVLLNASGQASTTVTLAGGAHELRAVYTGDTTHLVSRSDANAVQAVTTSTPSFTVSLTPVTPSSFPMVLTAGSSGTVAVTVTPENNSSLTGPMFVTLSCSGLPNQASCTFTPESVEILPSTPTSCTSGSPAADCPPVSSMVMQTVAASTTGQLTPAQTPGPKSNPVAWAFLLPGTLGLGGLAWGTRRRRWLSRLALVAMLGLVGTLGATACSPLYRYYQHAPPPNPPTPSGTYTITVTGQSNNGVTAISDNTTFVMTVQ